MTNILQVYEANPASAMQNTDLMYLGRSPYVSGNDMAITWANILATFLPLVYSNIQNESATTLLGNPTGSLAHPSEITLGLTLAFVGTVLQTVAMTGDVTTSANSFSTTIGPNKVSYPKMQQASASTLIGNPTGSLANIAEITLGATLNFSGTALQSTAHTGDATSSANSNALTLATVNTNTGSFGDASHVPQVTLNGKGLVTACASVLITPAAIGAPSGSGTSSGSNTGDQTITLTGPVTGTGTGSFATTLSANAVTTSTINNSAVTYAKIQNESATTILGNPTGSPAAPEEITLGATLAFSGTVLQTTAHTGDATSAANSNALTLATVNSNVGTFGDSSHSSQVTVNGKGLVTAASSVSITPAAIGAPSGSGTSSGANTGDQTITLTGDVTGSGTGSFASTIAANAVTYAKMQSETKSTLLGNPTGSNGVPSEITLGANLSFSGSTLVASGSSPLTTLGDLYGYSSANARVPVGSNYTVLNSDSTQSAGLGYYFLTRPSLSPSTGQKEDFLTSSTVNYGTVIANSGQVALNMYGAISSNYYNGCGWMKFNPNGNTTATQTVFLPSTSAQGGAINLGGGQIIVEAQMYVTALGSGGNAYTIYSGLSDGTNLAGSANWCLAEYNYNTNSGNFTLNTKNNGSTNTVNTSTTIAANTTYRLKWIFNVAGTSATFYVNDVSAGTTTTNLPTSANGLFMILELACTAGGTVIMWSDYMQWEQQFTTPR